MSERMLSMAWIRNYTVSNHNKAHQRSNRENNSWDVWKLDASLDFWTIPGTMPLAQCHWLPVRTRALTSNISTSQEHTRLVLFCALIICCCFPGWRHQMEAFSALLAICAGNSPVTGEFPSQKGQWRGALIFSLVCAWINGWVNNRETGDLRRHLAHYDVIVMHSILRGYTGTGALIWLCYLKGIRWNYCIFVQKFPVDLLIPRVQKSILVHIIAKRWTSDSLLP